MQKCDVEIIQVLLENKTIDLSISNLAKMLKKDYKNTHNVVTRLSKMKIVKLEPFGKAHKVSLIKKPHPLIIEAEHNRRETILKNRTINVMLSYFKNMNSVFYVMLLFGSYAKGTQSKHSDIDLMFVVPNGIVERMESEIMSISSIIPLLLHINIFSESEFKDMNMSKIITVGSEAINHNIILHGTEYFYEMIK